MSFKKILLDYMTDTQNRINILYDSTKSAFVLSAFVFFLLYFLVSGGFYSAILTPILPGLYVAFVLSFTFFCMAIVWKWGYKKLPSFVLALISMFMFGLGCVFLSPLFIG